MPNRYPTPLLDELQNLADNPGSARLRDCRALLQRGTDVNARDRDGRTALHQAVITPQVTTAFLRALVRAGADVNVTTNDGTTPLHHAAARGDLAKARVLLDAGAALSTASDGVMANGKTVLQTAVVNQHPAMVDLLLDRGADPNQPGWNHRLYFCQTFTAFHLAIQTDQVNVMERLLAAGADPNVLHITTDTQGPLPVTSTCRAIELANDAPRARAWLERRELLANVEFPVTGRTAPARPRRL